MSDKVFANGREISCKNGSGKSICAFPDVCFTPPQTPATPPGVPIPYPNTGQDGDTTSGSTSVSISGQEVMLKNKSYFKSSVGNEAGCAPKKGVVTSTNKGKVYFNSWSMDVKVEGENVVRHLDLTTHNHNPKPGQTPTWPFSASQTAGTGEDKCEGEKAREKAACKEFAPEAKGRGKSVCAAAGMTKGVRSLSEKQHLANAKAIQSAPRVAKPTATKREKALSCLKARRCRLVPYKKDQKGVTGCCPSQTPDHLMPKASFKKGTGKMPGWGKYSSSAAPCMCAEGPSNHGEGSHPLRHAEHKARPPRGVKAGQKMPYKRAVNHSAKGAAKVFKASGCTEACIKAQLDQKHSSMANNKTDPADVTYVPSGSVVSPKAIDSRISGLSK